MPAEMTSIDRLLDPVTIAIAGLSADNTKHGARVLKNLRNLDFSGQIWGVNPGTPEIPDVDVYPSISALPSPPDLVIAAVPGQAALDVVADSQGVGAIVLFASGFGETGEAGRRAEEDLLIAARATGSRLLGPNSGGVIRPGRGLAASFLTCLDRPGAEIRDGTIAVLTQSGGIGSYIHNLAAARGDGLGISISTGNEVDIKLGEALEAVTRLDEIQVVVAVIETLRDGERFIAAARGALRQGKRVVACRIGRGSAAQGLMSSHTGAMALPDIVVSGVLDSLGVTMADTPSSAYEIARLISRSRHPKGPRLGVVTHSGGFAILMSDLAEKSGGLDLSSPSSRLAGRIATQMDHGAVANPLDMGGIIGGPQRFAEVVDAFANSGEYDMVLAVSSAHPPTHAVSRAESLLAISTEAPILHLWLAGDQAEEGRAILESGDGAVTDDPRVAIGALAALAAEPYGGADLDPLHGPPESWGIPELVGVLAGSESEAIEAARSIGYPVVVKAEAAGLDHKTDIGAVTVDLRDDGEVVEAHRSIVDRLTAAGWTVRQTRIQPFRPGIEMIVGGIDDDSLGPLVVVGLGGVVSEALRDVAYAPAPVDESAARRMIDSLSGRRVLDGLRGTEPADVRELAEIVSLISRGVASRTVREFEINPLIWDGLQWLAADWLTVSRHDPS